MRKALFVVLLMLAIAAPAFAQKKTVQDKKDELGYTTNLTHDQLYKLLYAVAQEVQGGLLVKTSGNNCNGYSCDIICFSDDVLYDVLGDSEGKATPTWNRTTNPRGYKCALVEPKEPDPKPPSDTCDCDLGPIHEEIAEVSRKVDALQVDLSEHRKETQAAISETKNILKNWQTYVITGLGTVLAYLSAK